MERSQRLALGVLTSCESAPDPSIWPSRRRRLWTWLRYRWGEMDRYSARVGVSGALVAMRLADRLSVKSVTAHHRDRGSHAWTGTRLTASV